MRTRDAFVRTDFSELNQLFLHLDSRRQLSRRWWRPQVLAWCRTSATIEHGDMRPHVVSFIDRIFELDWTEERLHRLLDNHALVSFPLPPDLMLAELPTDIQSLIRADLEVHPSLQG